MAAPVLTSVPTLFSAWWCPWAQRTVIALHAKPEAAKSVTICEVPCDRGGPAPAWLTQLNPRGTIPFIAWKAGGASSSSSSSLDGSSSPSGDEVVAIAGSTVCNEYLNDAFPSPPLLPVDPVGRALARGLVQQIDDSLVPRLLDFITPEIMRKRDDASRAQAAASLDAAFTAVLRQLRGPLALGDQLSLVDCALAPHVLRMFVWKEINDYSYRGPEAALAEKLQRYHEALLGHPAVEASLVVPRAVDAKGDFHSALLNHYVRFAVAQIFS